MQNSLEDVKSAFWNVTKLILKDIIKENQDRWIRRMYPTNGAPDWKVTDNIVFLNANTRDEDYSKQRDSLYKAEQGTIMRHTMRTRVWDLAINAYGPKSFEMVEAMKDGVFKPEAQSLLAKKKIYLVPYMQTPVQSNEIFAGQWWERWNLNLTFNEEYSVVDDVGSIQTVTVRAEALR